MEMSNKRTIKALEELVKTEYMAVAALDNALEEVEDNKLRRQYRKWRDSHMKQAEALNVRLEDLAASTSITKSAPARARRASGAS